MLNYAKEHSVAAAARKFNISVSSLAEWNKKLKIYKAQKRDFTDKRKMKMLNYAKEHGPTEASRKFNVSIASLRTWNKEFKIYEVQEHRDFTDYERVEVLSYAKEYSAAAAGRKFDIHENLISAWNRKFKIYRIRGQHDFAEEEISPEEIDVINASVKLRKAKKTEVFRRAGAINGMIVTELVQNHKKIY